MSPLDAPELGWFAVSDTGPDQTDIGLRFLDLAWWLWETLPPGPERIIALRRLHEARAAALASATHA